jgi:predicted dehydrogenase
MSGLRVGVIGLGVGEQHAAAYAADARCELVTLCDLSDERLAQAGERWPTARVTTRATEVLQASDIDLVSIASYDDLHFEQALAALEAGKHVFVEKPLCRSPAELRALKAAVAGRDVALASNLVLRAAPLYKWLREQIAAGNLGTAYGFDGDYLYGRLRKITEGWRKDVENYSVMLGGGVHLIDLMLWTTGERPIRVAAVGNRISTQGTAFRYLDHVAATFEFESGLIGRISANFGAVHQHQHVVRVFGTRSTLTYDDRGARIHSSRDEPPSVVDLPALPASKGELIPAFVTTVLAGSDSTAAIQHEFDVISACLAADRALAEGEKVDIDYV